LRLRRSAPGRKEKHMDTTPNSGRRRRGLGLLTAIGTATVLLFAAPAHADDAKSEAASGDAKKDDAKKDAAASPVREDQLKRYYFLGVRVRDVVVPQFILELFAKGGATGNAWLIGPELSMRKDSTEIDISLSYADYGFGPAMFRGKNDGDIAYETVQSNLKLGYLTFDLLFDIPLDKSGMFSFLVGGGVGVGFVAGDLYREQAYPTSGTPDGTDPKKWAPCTGPGDPNGVVGGAQYCDGGNDHFYNAQKKQHYSEKSWLDGGSKPIVFPWLSLPQLSLRVKPIKQLQIRADVGFSVTGFFFGGAAGYGF
jgi:hypothetical protein